MADTAAEPIIVIPCYNEAKRLDIQAFRSLASTGKVHLLFVDDGSTDDTARILKDLIGKSGSMRFLTLGINSGKAEAVRRGLLVAIDHGAAIVGYYDADLATPPHELMRLLSALESDQQLIAVLGSRVAMLGSNIERRQWRHYLGRIYGTLASWALGVAVYDTQCGAKIFRAFPHLQRAIVAPFRTTWAFDVELLNRLLSGDETVPAVPVDAIREVPLGAWRDVPGSTLRLRGTLRATIDLARIRARRRGSQRFLSENVRDGKRKELPPKTNRIADREIDTRTTRLP